MAAQSDFTSFHATLAFYFLAAPLSTPGVFVWNYTSF